MEYTVRFIHARRLYRFRPRDLGAWYDLTAVFAAMNQALADTSAPERFIAIQPDPPYVFHAFAAPSAFEAAAAELGIVVGGDLNADRAREIAEKQRILEDARQR